MDLGTQQTILYLVSFIGGIPFFQTMSSVNSLSSHKHSSVLQVKNNDNKNKQKTN